MTATKTRKKTSKKDKALDRFNELYDYYVSRSLPASLTLKVEVNNGGSSRTRVIVDELVA